MDSIADGAPPKADVPTTLLTAGATIAAGAWLKYLSNRASRAQALCERSESAGNPLEEKRDKYIKLISELRNEVNLSITEPVTQQKLLCLILEQSVLAYEATTQRTLDLVQINADQIKAHLANERKGANDRNRARWIGVATSVICLFGITAFLYHAQQTGFSGTNALPVLGVPACVILWSCVGSFAAILYRFTNADDREIKDPLRWLFSRPLTGVVMGTITFLVIKAGLLAITPQSGAALSTPGTAPNELMWLVAFLAGFSDRFSDGLLNTLMGNIAKAKPGELVGMVTESQTSAGTLEVLPALIRPQEFSIASTSATVTERQQQLEIVKTSAAS